MPACDGRTVYAMSRSNTGKRDKNYRLLRDHAEYNIVYINYGATANRYVSLLFNVVVLQTHHQFRSLQRYARTPFNFLQ